MIVAYVVRKFSDTNCDDHGKINLIETRKKYIAFFVGWDSATVCQKDSSMQIRVQSGQILTTYY